MNKLSKLPKAEWSKICPKCKNGLIYINLWRRELINEEEEILITFSSNHLYCSDCDIIFRPKRKLKLIGIPPIRTFAEYIKTKNVM